MTVLLGQTMQSLVISIFAFLPFPFLQPYARHTSQQVLTNISSTHAEYTRKQILLRLWSSVLLHLKWLLSTTTRTTVQNLLAYGS